jgi:hypothetical protein
MAKPYGRNHHYNIWLGSDEQADATYLAQVLGRSKQDVMRQLVTLAAEHVRNHLVENPLPDGQRLRLRSGFTIELYKPGGDLLTQKRLARYLPNAVVVSDTTRAHLAEAQKLSGKSADETIHDLLTELLRPVWRAQRRDAWERQERAEQKRAEAQGGEPQRQGESG